MKAQYKILTFLNNFNIGISVPFLSLILCEHGCSLENLGLAISIFSISVVILELPSGIFADLFGRKSAFLLAQIGGLISSVLLLLSNTFCITAIGLLFYGFSSAFSSGSLDALAVEDSVKRNGESALSKAISTFQIYTCAGVALGALFGGFLPYTTGYFLHLILKIFVVITTFLFAQNLPKETGFVQRQKHIAETDSVQQHISLKMHLCKMLNLFSSNKFLRQLAICIIALSTVQAAVETYWQPQMSAFQPEHLQQLLGILSASAYLTTIAGCTFINKFKMYSVQKSQTIYFSVAFIFLLIVFSFAFAQNVIFFSIIYLTIYLLIGMISIAEQTMINLETEDCVRASILSMNSLFAKSGAIVSSGISSVILHFSGIGTVWIAFSLTAFCILLLEIKER